MNGTLASAAMNRRSVDWQWERRTCKEDKYIICGHDFRRSDGCGPLI